MSVEEFKIKIQVFFWSFGFNIKTFELEQHLHQK
jgi:hypothetical protein